MVSNCKKVIFKRKKICRGDFRHKIQLYKREQASVSYGGLEPTESFSLVAEPFAAVETVRGTTRFAEINIEERPTHIFNIVYTSYLFNTVKFDELEKGNYFVRFKGRNYLVLNLENIDEDNQYIAIQTTERGTATLEASKA